MNLSNIKITIDHRLGTIAVDDTQSGKSILFAQGDDYETFMQNIENHKEDSDETALFNLFESAGVFDRFTHQ